MNENDFQRETVTVNVCTDPGHCGPATRSLGQAMKEETIYRALKDTRNGLGLKGKVLVQKTNCQGWCDYAPVCTLWPSGKVYRDLKPKEAEAFLKEAVIEDRHTFDNRKIWQLTLGPEENFEERKKNGIVNPAKKK